MTCAALTPVGVAPVFGQDVAPTSVQVDSIVVYGYQRHSPTEVIDRSGLRVGNIVQFQQVADAIRRLMSTGDYNDVVISVTPESPAIFYIGVDERPYISHYVFEGLKHVSEGQLRDTVGLARNAPLDPNRIARARAYIQQRLSNEGFPSARIDTALVADSTQPGDFFAVFRVDEGPRLGITLIEFEGNDAFTDAELRGAMATTQEGFLWRSPGELKRDQYNEDLNRRLPEFYASHGYLDFQVLGDTIITDPVTGKGRVRIRVDEGPQYFLSNLDVTGSRRFPAGRIEELVRARQEDPDDGELPPFDFPAFQESAGEVGDQYRNIGHLSAQVVPDIRKIPPDDEDPRHRVDAVLNVIEGNPTYLHEVAIEGNTYTHDRVIRNRLFIFPGDVYSQDRLIRSVQAIQGLGFFEPLPPDQSIQFVDRPDGDMDVTLRVQEKQTGTVNFGVTASGIGGFAGFIGYSQPNLFGQAKTGSFRWIFGGRQQDFDISYSDPEILGSPYSGTITLRNSRDRFTGFSLGDRRQTGGLFEVGVPLLGLRSTRMFFGYSIFRDRVSGIDTTNISDVRRSLLSGTRSSLSWRLVQDTRNNPLFPTAGSRNTLSIRHTGGFLGGSGDYQKIDAQSEWYVPVARLGGNTPGSLPIEFTFAMNFEAGAILGDNPFFTERYFVGGTQAGVQLRGYEEATITPLGHVPRGQGVNLSDLSRVGQSYFKTGAAFGVRLTSSIFASTFLDAGNVWQNAEQLNPTDLLLGAGVGVSLVTPFGPLGLDYAYGFDRRDALGNPDPGWQLHFKFGRVF